MIRIALLAGIIFSQLSPDLYAQEKVLLRFSPSPGLELNSVFNTNTIIDQEFMGINQRIEMKMMIQTHSRILATTDTQSIMEASYQRLAFESKTPDNRINIDTESPENASENKYLKPMLNQPFKVFFNKRGEVTNVKGLQEIISRITRNTNPDDPAAILYTKMLHETFGMENIRNNMAYISPIYPTEKVQKGDSWTYNREISSAQLIFMMKSTSTLKETDPAGFKVQTLSEIESPTHRTLEFEGMNTRMALKGTQLSESSVDPGSGISKETIVRQTIEGNFYVNTENNQGGTMKVPMKIQSKMEIRTDITNPKDRN